MPKVIWTVKVTGRELVNRIPIIAKELVGHVDNSNHPLINVDIKMVLVVPTKLKRPVPVLMMVKSNSETKVMQLNSKFIKTVHGDKLTITFDENKIAITFLNSVSENSKNSPDKREKLMGVLKS